MRRCRLDTRPWEATKQPLRQPPALHSLPKTPSQVSPLQKCSHFSVVTGNEGVTPLLVHLLHRQAWRGRGERKTMKGVWSSHLQRSSQCAQHGDEAQLGKMLPCLTAQSSGLRDLLRSPPSCFWGRKGNAWEMHVLAFLGHVAGREGQGNEF